MKYKGIILSSNQYNDNDKIVNLITENGLISFKAKGIRKSISKNKPILFDLSIVEVELLNRNNKNILINGKLLVLNDNLYSNYYGLLFINVIKEIIIKLMLDEEKRLIYNDLLFCLNKFSTIKDLAKYEYYSYLYILYLFNKILKIIGYDYESYKNDDSIVKIFGVIKSKKEIEASLLKEKILTLISFVEDQISINLSCKDLII